jgi:hypothetical protein
MSKMDNLKLLAVAHRFGQWEVAYETRDGKVFQFKVVNVRHSLIQNVQYREELTYLIARNAEAEGVGDDYVIHTGEIVDTGRNWSLPEGVHSAMELLYSPILKNVLKPNEQLKSNTTLEVQIQATV